jgi:hypothetical protein
MSPGFSHMTARAHFLSSLLYISVVCCLFFLDAGVLRIIAAVPLVFYYPGSTILRAMKLPNGDSLLLTLGISIATVVCVGFLLNLFDLLNPIGWLVSLSAVTLMANALAWFRGTSFTADWPAVSGLRLHHAAMTLLAVMVLCWAYRTATQAAETHQFHYTDFWMLPDGRPSTGRYTIGVKNNELEAQTYDIRVMVDGTIVLSLHDISIEPGRTVERGILLPVDRRTKAEAWLLRSEDPSKVYRRVSAAIEAKAQ